MDGERPRKVHVADELAKRDPATLTPRERRLVNLAKRPGFVPWWLKNDHPERQCVGTARSTGARCRAPALKGATRCARHGGRRELIAKGKATPETIAKAAESRAASEWVKEIARNPVPADVKRGDAWQRSLRFQGRAGLRVRYLLTKAWHADDGAQWRDAVRELEALERAADARARGERVT